MPKVIHVSAYRGNAPDHCDIRPRKRSPNIASEHAMEEKSPLIFPMIQKIPFLVFMFIFLVSTSWGQRENSFIRWVLEEPREKDLPVPDCYLHETFWQTISQMGACVAHGSRNVIVTQCPQKFNNRELYNGEGVCSYTAKMESNYPHRELPIEESTTTHGLADLNVPLPILTVK